jgi:hypothetical protein
MYALLINNFIHTNLFRFSLLSFIVNAIYFCATLIAISPANNVFIAIYATSNILYCNISSQQYIYCNICDHQYIVLQYLQPTMYLLQYMRPSIYCIVNNILQYIVNTIYFLRNPGLNPNISSLLSSGFEGKSPRDQLAVQWPNISSHTYLTRSHMITDL